MQVEGIGIVAFVPPVVPSDPSKKVLELRQIAKQIETLGTTIKSVENQVPKKDLSIMYFNYGKLFETGSFYVEQREHVLKFLASAFHNYGNARKADPELDKLDSEVGKGIDRVGFKLVSMGAARLVEKTPVQAENPDLLKSKDVSDLSKQKKPKKHKDCIIL